MTAETGAGRHDSSIGNVQLWGVIDTEDQRKALRVVVEGIPGVKGLKDHLTKTLST